MKQRALLVSIVLQILIVAALVLVPLLSKGENIANRLLLYPTVPYAPPGNPNHPKGSTRPSVHRADVCRICPPHFIPPNIVPDDSHPPRESGEAEEIGLGIPGLPAGDGVVGGWTRANERREPLPPNEHRVPPAPVRYKISEPVQTAMLIRRVQPTYPPLAIQIHREGRVELRAIIATDGTVQSLEVISGDPLLIQSALAAVRDWRYRPTILNGQPVEVDTHITVIYTLNH